MRYSAMFCVVIVLIAAFFTSSVSADMVSRYSFTTDASDTVSGYNADLVNGAAVSGGQVVFDGTDDYVRLPAPSIAINTFPAITLEMWLTSSTGNAGKFTMAAAFGTRGSTGYDYLDFQPTRSSGNARAGITNDTYNTEVASSYSASIADGVEHHIVITVDSVYITLYVDGIAQAAGELGSTTISGLSNTSAYLARSTFTGDPYFAGSINEFRIYNSLLSPSEIQQNYQLGPDDVILTESNGSTAIFTGGEGTTDTYQIRLASEPTASVVITADPPAELNLGAGAGAAIQKTFTTSDWDQPQTITVASSDPQTPQELTACIQHTAVSSDPFFNAIPIRDICVNIMAAECGALGYLEGDYNLDCDINLFDFSLLAQVWLVTDAPLDLNEVIADWLKSTMIGQQGAVEGPVKKSAQPFAINTANITHTVEENVYGQFYEHIYHSANGGLWGEMVWNRSFELDASSGGGLWSIEGSELVQSSLSTDVHMEFGDTSWTDYELTLQARKDGGNEGFLILFRAADTNNFYWLNIGGWNNTKHAIEKEVDGSRSTVSSSYTGSITTGQWYNIRVRCEGNHFQAYLDEVLIVDYTDSSSPHTVGAIGLGTWATQARYRNIQVTDLAGSTVLYSGLPTLPENPFAANFWNSFGSGTFTLDTDSLNDDRSVKIVASGPDTGLLQNNFKFIPQTYHGSLWMKGTLPAGVSVELLDGTSVLGQIALGAPTSSWTQYSFPITPVASTNSGSLRISLLGAGTVYIDQVSMMGQDAIDTGGYRPDLLQAVSDLRPPIIRWPGGCFASLYLWKDGIGPQHNRHRYSAYMWEDQDTNSYGTDEFLRMCEQIGAKPLICINTGVLNSACGAPAQWKLSPDTQENYIQYALDWMEYCNGDINTTWGAIRAANGHPEPYNVEYWEIDNETWAAGSAAYITRVQAFAPAMQAKAAELGVPIQISAVGGGSYDQSWNEDIIDSCATLIDYISVHHYEGSGGYKSGPASYEGFLEWLAGYIAASANPDMKIYNSEWNLQTTDWRTGLFAGGILNVYERQGANFKIGGPALFLRHTSASDWDNAFINFDHTGWFAAPNYVVMKLWWDHYAPYAVETTGTGMDLNVSSVLSEDGKTLQIHVVNADPTEKSVAFEIAASFVPQTAYMHYVAPGDLYARNTLANPNAVHVQAKVVGIDGQTIRLLMPAYSAGVVTVTTE